MAATIHDVARHAGVAPSTVSAVLNQRGYVHPDTLARVQQAIRELDYTPRRSARNLTNRTSGNIGFIVLDRHFTRAEPFYTRVFIGAEMQARQHDLYVLLTTVPDNYSTQKHLPRFLVEHNVDGVIVAGMAPDRLVHDIMKTNVPVVFVDYGADDIHASRVLIENREGVSMATRHLIDKGHQKIGFIGSNDGHPSERERYLGFEDAMREAHLPVHAEWIDRDETDTTLENGVSAFTRIWQSDPRPDAIICFNDAIALGVIHSAASKGVRVPDELAVVGFDDVEAAHLVQPALTTMRVVKEDLGAAAVQALVDRISNPGRNPATTRIRVELIERASSVSPEYHPVESR